MLRRSSLYFKYLQDDKLTDSSIFLPFRTTNLPLSILLETSIERVENMVGKRENPDDKCHLFTQSCPHSHTMTPFDAPWKQAF